MLYADIRTETHHDKRKRTELVFGFSRVPTPWHSFHKAVFGAVVTLLLFLAVAAMIATDVPDHKPTTNLLGRP